jgi:hypothetical protein
MASLSRALNINLVFLLKGKGVDEATKQLKGLGKSFDGLNTKILSAAGAFAAFKAGGALVKFGGAAIDEARDLERNLNGLGTVFEGLTPQMRQFSIDAVNMGLSMNEAAKASTFIGSVLKQSGFSIQETADVTEKLVALGADLAITYGYDVQEALLGMTALFRGEYDPIEKFGVAMKQSEVNALMAERGLDKLTGAGRRLAEQEIRLELLLSRSSDALGAYSRQATGLFASQQRLRATFENLQAVVGFKLTPAFAELVSELIPLIEQLIPAGIAIFESLIPVVQGLTANKEQLKNTVLQVAETFLVIVKVMAFFAAGVVNNITVIKNLVIGFGALLVGVKVWVVFRQAIDLVNAGLVKVPARLGLVTKALGVLRIAIAASGIGILITLLGTAFAAIVSTTDGLSKEMASIQSEMDKFNLDSVTQESVEAVTGANAITDALTETAGAAGSATDAVGDFFKSMANDAQKLAARLQLEAFGASKGLIEKILGSGEDWYKVFQEVTRQGMSSVQNVQAMFLQTAAGFDEAMDKWQQEFDAFKEFEKQALAAKDAFVEFAREFKVLPSIAEQIGEFERSSLDSLKSFEDKLKEAFDNKYLLDESYQNLLAYARDEFSVLRQIERQRDSLLARRNAAEALITQVQQSIAGSATLVDLMRNVQDSAEQVNIVEFAQRTVSAGNELRGFRTALISNFSEPIEQAGSSAAKLVQSYRSVVDRTREFVENLKALRALGLDPQLFNQLVQAGVEAGGATAQALVEGGADTITEINGLFAELDALGVELGENTAQVMYGQGENFVDGIVKGLESQLDELESMANSLAESFTKTFEEVLIAGIERAIAAAEAALSRMPQAPNMNFNFGGGGGGGGGGGEVSGRTSIQPPLSNTLLNAARQANAAAAVAASSARAEGNRFSQIQSMQQAPPISGLGGRQYAPSLGSNNITINNYSPSERIFQNTQARLATTTANSNSGSRSNLSAKVGT